MPSQSTTLSWPNKLQSARSACAPSTPWPHFWENSCASKQSARPEPTVNYLEALEFSMSSQRSLTRTSSHLSLLAIETSQSLWCNDRLISTFKRMKTPTYLLCLTKLSMVLNAVLPGLSLSRPRFIALWQVSLLRQSLRWSWPTRGTLRSSAPTSVPLRTGMRPPTCSNTSPKPTSSLKLSRLLRYSTSSKKTTRGIVWLSHIRRMGLLGLQLPLLIWIGVQCRVACLTPVKLCREEMSLTWSNPMKNRRCSCQRGSDRGSTIKALAKAGTMPPILALHRMCCTWARAKLTKVWRSRSEN